MSSVQRSSCNIEPSLYEESLCLNVIGKPELLVFENGAPLGGTAYKNIYKNKQKYFRPR